MLQNKTRRELNPSEEMALGALLAGRTVTEAAEAANVHRSTVHRWSNDEHFRAEFNSRRTELQTAMEEQIHQLQETAVGVVEGALAHENVNVALALLKGTGLVDGRKRAIGSTDPEGEEEVPVEIVIRFAD